MASFDVSRSLEDGVRQDCASSDGESILQQAAASGSCKVESADEEAGENVADDGEDSPAALSPSAPSTTDRDETHIDPDVPSVEGLAILKSRDNRYGMYRVFEKERARYMDFKAAVIADRVRRIEKIERRSRAGGSKKHASLQPRGKYGREWNKLMTELGKDLEDYDKQFTSWKAISEYGMPSLAARDSLQNWIRENIADGSADYHDAKLDQFRMLVPADGIETFANSMSSSRLGRFALLPFRREETEGEEIVLSEYSPQPFVAMRNATVLFVVALFFVLPIALLAFQVVESLTVGAVCVLLFGLAFASLIVVVVAPGKTDLEFVLIFSYAAFMTGYLANWAMNK